MVKKISILFVYHRMVIGGSTSALLSLLSGLDKDKYKIDLALFENKGPLLHYLPTHVTLLPQIKSQNPFSIIACLFDINLYKALFFKIFTKKPNIAMQLMSHVRLHYSKRIKIRYDFVVGFLECWPSFYSASNKVKCGKRIAWIHTDYLSAGFRNSYDTKPYRRLDKIVTVSDSGLNTLKNIFPDYVDKIMKIENIVSPVLLEKLSLKECSIVAIQHPVFIVVCRMDIHVKGLDRLIDVLSLLDKENLSFSCYFVGNDDSGSFKSLLSHYSFRNTVQFLGPQLNPYPFMKASDMCLLVSRFEGKPIVVTEALALGVPVLVTNYLSAKEQVLNGINGIIVDNDFDSIYLGIKSLLTNPNLLIELKNNLKRSEKKDNDILFNQLNVLFSKTEDKELS